MDDLISSLILPEKIDEFLSFSPLPLELFGEECNQATLFGIQNDPVVKKVPKRKSKLTCDDGGDVDHKRKKTLHREFEKQRRQEMSALYRSLRSLLPHDYHKGRSVADHVQGVVSYIQHMQKRIERLHEARDNLRKTLNCETIDGFMNNILNFADHSVQIEVTKTGFQVIASTSLNGGVPLSKLLEVLNREGFNVISSTSTISNENMLHVIESQVNIEGMEINLSELENKLMGHVF